MKRLTLTFFILTFISSASLCQILTPVKWQFGSKKVNDKEAVVFLKATMDKGWHIYSLNVPEGGPIKTSFDFESDGGYTLIGKAVEPRPKTKYEKVFDLDVPYFDNEVVFQQKIKLDKQKEVKIRGVVSFSACNAESCLPEDEVEFVVVIK
ncbi:Disulphide bond corrector protein DsbC [Parapedobacter koreensis]|uniref:Disulphide bond corrector protein DsbC n=2 Tax=Parapedobacter koreensis TaxID=332977 RepID=A0A1H7MV91_9SPHI|nr:Disulphide bond corrector protein DsbC [Parapedobacter koreensis]